MVCIVTAEFCGKVGAGHSLLACLSEMIPETRKKNGAISIDICVDQDNSDRVVLVERWDSRSHHENYVAYRKKRGDIDKIMTMLSAPPKFIWSDLIDA